MRDSAGKNFPRGSGAFLKRLRIVEAVYSFWRLIAYRYVLGSLDVDHEILGIGRYASNLLLLCG